MCELVLGRYFVQKKKEGAGTCPFRAAMVQSAAIPTKENKK